MFRKWNWYKSTTQAAFLSLEAIAPLTAAPEVSAEQAEEQGWLAEMHALIDDDSDSQSDSSDG
ncbi:hypothetical protein GZ77_01325 [Endozoicomonas montiporae]|uniref:Uncharacterized protein n=2 Tax=Endozoicomonas montiporae TaxID=1027273 RepID=A0A081NA52_9GAMM|nr:hypothetical protein [Endozoicomonas montiporae]AMO56995.1 hypothetical protein EZMO1_2956 [Endozoicomonas montiporae CL-33]KEQ15325.1 hypothetical protein GZ77_01325 [Endozoicomonas montiporae]